MYRGYVGKVILFDRRDRTGKTIRLAPTRGGGAD
jgi:hypothetical protein